MRGTVVLLIALLSAACPGRSTKAPENTLNSDFVPEIDNGFEALKKSLESTVLENYAQLTYDNLEAVVDSVAIDRELQFMGVTPSDVIMSDNPSSLLVERRLFPKRFPRVLSKNLDVHLSQDGSVAWVFDEISYRVRYMNKEASIPIRLTAVYVRDVERWVLVAENRSFGIATDKFTALVKADKQKKGKKINNDYGDDKKLAIKLLGIIGRFINTGEGVHDNEESLVVFHQPAQELRMPITAESLSLGKQFGPSATVALQEFRVQVSNSKKFAWIAANLGVSTEIDGRRRTMHLRGSFLLEKLNGLDWGLVQVHVGVPLLERQISTRIFGPN